MKLPYMRPLFREIISAERIQTRIQQLGQEISKDFKGQKLTVIGVLKGSFVFMSDLIRKIQLPLCCDFLKVSSYDANGRRGRLYLEFDLSCSIKIFW